MLKLGNFNENTMEEILNELNSDTKYIFIISGESYIDYEMLSDYNIDLAKYGAVYDEDDEIWIDPTIDPEKDNEFEITDNILKDFFESMSDYTEQDLQFIKSYNENSYSHCGSSIFIQCKTTKPMTLKELFDTLLQEDTVFCGVCFDDESDLADCLQTNSANMNGEIVQINR